MYLIKLYEDGVGSENVTIHSPYVGGAKISDGQISYVLGSVHDFNFMINIKNPAWGKIKPLKSIVTVTDMLRNKVIYEGRALQPNYLMDSNGMFTKKIVCESLLAYLLDSTQRHAEIHDTTIADFLQIILDNHNAQVEPHKQFKLGDVTALNTTDNVYRYLGYENTFDTIKDKLVDRIGGYLQVRREVDGLYLDYLAEPGVYVPSTPIKLAKNMQSVEYEIDPTEIITRLIPLGESLESDDDEAADASQAKLTIESVNDGIDYIDDEELIAEFGIIGKSVEWSGVTTASRLLTNGLNFLKEQKAAIIRLNVDSTNSNLLDSNLAEFEIGNYHDLINPVIHLNEIVRIIEKKVDILSPQKSSLKIGDKTRTLTEYQVSMKDTKKEVVELKNTVQHQTKRLATIQTELKNVDNVLQDLNDAIGNADIPALEDAIGNLNQAVSDLIDAVDAIPVYDPATESVDGLMSAADKIKVNLIDVISNIDLDALKDKLDLITVINAVDLDGIKAKSDLLTVTNTIDLNQLYDDVENLKNE